MSAVSPFQETTDKPLDAEALKRDFPILQQPMSGKPLAFLDSAASAQTPERVIEAEARVYREYYANIHRGVYKLSQQATQAYEGVRAKVRDLINAPDEREIVYVRGTTEAINLVAHSFVRPRLQAGDEILITEMEHHSNIVPWQVLAEETGAHLVVVPIDDNGEIDPADFSARISERTKFASVVHVSNVLGTINPVEDLTRRAHERGVPILVDGAQAVPHRPVDVQAIGCDFYCFSAHKVYGPSGIGALWGRYELLADMPPYQSGGDMIRYVTLAKTEYAKPPQRFEAGTPNIAGVIAMGEGIDYLREVGPAAVARHEQALLAYANERLSQIEGLRIIGNAENKAGVISFVIDGAHPHDMGTIMDQEGVAIRAGHHCAQPVMDHFGLAATARASFGLYNTEADVDALVRGIDKVKELFG